METFVTRQTVFDPQQGVAAYRLLFRAGAAASAFADPPRLKAVAEALAVDPLGKERPLILDLSPELLQAGPPEVLPPDRTLLRGWSGLLTEPNRPAVAAICGRGYTLSIPVGVNESWAGLAGIVEADPSDPAVVEQAAKLASRARPGTRLFARGVDSRALFTKAVARGFSMIQGSFLDQPDEGVARKDLPAFKLAYLQLMAEVNRGEPSVDAMERVIRRDVSLSVRLLKYINSAAFNLQRKVDSIRLAITLLGVAQMRQWVSLLAVSSMSEGKPPELLATALRRARFCEQLALQAGSIAQAPELFLVGMLSCLDAILDRPMLDLMKDLPVTDAMRTVLLGGREGAGRILGAALAYEKAEWDRLPVFLERIPVDVLKLPGIYRDALAWTRETYAVTRAG